MNVPRPRPWLDRHTHPTCTYKGIGKEKAINFSPRQLKRLDAPMIVRHPLLDNWTIERIVSDSYFRINKKMVMEQRRFQETVLFDDIPDTGLDFSFEDIPGLLDEVPDCTPKGPIHAHLRLTRRGRNIWAEGTMECNLDLVCHRCLAPYPFPLRLQYAYLLIPRDVRCDMKEEISLRPKDLDVAFFNGVSLELFDVFREQVLLSLPVKQLCKEDCKGLCPGCGRDLNHDECVCAVLRPDNPFSCLKKLKLAQ